MTSDFARQISIYDAALRLSSFIPGSYSCTATRVRLQNLICQESKMKSLKSHAFLWNIIELII